MSLDKQNFQKLLAVVGQIRPVNPEANETSLLKRDLGFSSLDFVDLLFELDQAFATEMTMWSLNQFIVEEGKRGSWDLTLAELMKFIEKQGAFK